MSQPTQPQVHADMEVILRAFERVVRADRRAAARLLRALRQMLTTEPTA